MMNSRERLLTALIHQEPDRMPIDFGGTLLSSIQRVLKKRNNLPK
jgi:hypothetical protein